MNNFERSIFVIVVAATVAAGCSRPSVKANVCDSVECGRTTAAQTVGIDLLSINSGTCTLANARLTNCSIRPQTSTFETFETAVPLRTTVTSQVTGTCPTKYPLQVSLAPDGQAA